MSVKQWRLARAGTAVAVLGLCAGTAAAQGTSAREARADAVKKIMAKVGTVSLGHDLAARDLFAAVPKLRSEAEIAVWAVTRQSPVANTAGGGWKVDVVVRGGLVQSRLERATARMTLPARFARISLSRIGGRGITFKATGRAGVGTTLPRTWRRVSEQDRDVAVRAARLQALAGAVEQLAETARQRKAAGASSLLAVVRELTWVRAHAGVLTDKGARDMRRPTFRDDGTVQVMVEVPATALLATLEQARGRAVLAARVRQALRRALHETSGIGRGLGRAPGTAGAMKRPRLIWSEAQGRPAEDKRGLQAQRSAKYAAWQIARARLVEQIRRLSHDARRTVGDLLSQHRRLEASLGRFVTANAREMASRAVHGDRWYIKLELNLDGLDAALR